ncbi:MAG: hypothetical protein AABW81_02835 [Nanoarchaeota archaeon]
MGKAEEISPWKFAINSLYSVKDRMPLSLDHNDKMYFWKYTLIALEKIKKEFSDKELNVYADRNSLENAISISGLYIKTKNKKLFLSEDMDIFSVNKYLKKETEERLTKIFREAYDEMLN